MVTRKLNLLKLLKKGESAFLFGPRGVGKSMLANEFLSTQKHSWTLDFLQGDTFERYLKAPSVFRMEVEKKLEKIPRLTILLDEIQKVPSLLDEVHSLLEKHPGKIQFLLTGSSARKLKKSGANLLGGRAWVLNLFPLGSEEIDLDLEKALTIGTLPGIYLGATSPERNLRAYVQTYLKEEIKEEGLVRRLDGFARFLDLAGQMNAEPVNFSAISRESRVSVKTVQEYFNILEDTLVVRRIDGWSASVRKQLLHAPKYYFFDCGVLNALSGELTTELRGSSYRYGRLFETFIVNEIIKKNMYDELDRRFHYWRTNTGAEVDLVMAIGKRPVAAIEIKSSKKPLAQDIQGLFAFKEDYPDVKAYCLCQTPQAYKLKNVTVLPWREGLKKIFT